jgi:hypothetical protein
VIRLGFFYGTKHDALHEPPAIGSSDSSTP